MISYLHHKPSAPRSEDSPCCTHSECSCACFASPEPSLQLSHAALMLLLQQTWASSALAPEGPGRDELFPWEGQKLWDGEQDGSVGRASTLS